MSNEPRTLSSSGVAEPVLNRHNIVSRRKAPIVIFGFITVVVLVIGSVIGFVVKGTLDSGVQSDLQNELDFANSQLLDLRPKLDDYASGIKEAEDIQRDNSEGNKKSETDATDSSNSSGDSGLTPQTASAPFMKDGVIVVNKKHPLPENYAPGEDFEARTAADKLVDAGIAAGVNLIHSYSSFRSYSTQAGLFNSYSAQSGVAVAETYSARPGYSEHQTGLAFDLKSSGGGLYRISDNSYNYQTDWVSVHAAEYGFIVRYRDEWQSITGYMGEPWHLRYLGVDLAQKVADSGKTLEEYLGVDGGDYVR